MEIQTDDYTVKYDSITETVTFNGSLRLSDSEEYSAITKFLTEVADKAPEKINLDLKNLEFLNSSGINMLSKFVITVRQRDISITVYGSKAIPWQGKSLKNLQKLMPRLQLEIE